MAKASAFAAGGALGAAAATAGLLATQVEQAKRTIGVRSTAPPYADTRYGKSKGPSIRLVMIGDSVAASLGADDPRDTIGARLASLVSEYDGRAVMLSTVADVGARSKNLKAQVTRALHYRPHVAVIIIGGNDVTHMVPQRRSIKYLDAAVRRLRAEGVQVVVGTVPDFGKIGPIHPPLRWVLQRLGKSLAKAQTICVVEAEGRAVSMGDLLGPEFGLRPGELFSADQFHPSTEGYEAVAQTLAPSVLAAMSRGETGEVLPDIFQAPTVAPLSQIAAQATEITGVEVSGAAPGAWSIGSETGDETLGTVSIGSVPSDAAQTDAIVPKSSRWARMGRRKLPPRTAKGPDEQPALDAESGPGLAPDH